MEMGFIAHFLLLLCVKLTMNVMIMDSLCKVKKKVNFFKIFFSLQFSSARNRNHDSFASMRLEQERAIRKK